MCKKRSSCATAWNLETRQPIQLAMDACVPAGGYADLNPFGRREAARGAVPLAAAPNPTSYCSTSRPTTSTPNRWHGWKSICKRYKGTVIAVTHDRYFLDNVAGWILELDRGFGIPWKGNYSSWLEQKQARLGARRKRRAQTPADSARELEWIHTSQKARQAKGKARVSAYNNLLSQEFEQRREELEIYIPPGPRLGDVVVECKGVTKAYGDHVLVESLTFDLPPGGIVGVIGPNGAGKTTLLKMIIGAEQADAGTIRIGETVKLGYVDQSRDTLNNNNTVWEEISGGEETLTLGARRTNSRAYVASFNFLGSDQQKQVGALSGGERNRVLLAKMLKEGANVILLDEPTNDLDVNTLRALEEALEAFAGLRRHRQPRPLVPRPRGDARAGL